MRVFMERNGNKCVLVRRNIEINLGGKNKMCNMSGDSWWEKSLPSRWGEAMLKEGIATVELR